MFSSADNPSSEHTRASRQKARLRGAAVTVACLILGALLFLISFGVNLEIYGDDGVARLKVFLIVDLFMGVVAASFIGTARSRGWLNYVIAAAGPVSVFVVPAWFVAVLRLGERRRIITDVAIVLIMVLGGSAHSYAQDRVTGEGLDLWAVAIGSAVITMAVLAWGRARGARKELLITLEEKAHTAQEAKHALLRQQEAELARARAEERSAIARDMHDGVSHQLAITAMHTGALATRDDFDPQEVQKIARTARDSAAHAGALLREALVALRGGEEPNLLPGVSSVSGVFESARAQGLDLHLKGPIPQVLGAENVATTQLANIFHEAFANATRHAPLAPVTVEFESAPEALHISISNPIPEEPPASEHVSGFGLVGIEERAGMVRGDATHSVVDSGTTFELKVSVPWESINPSES